MNDDVTPGAHPYVVISYDYWKRRFGRDPKAVGRTFRADMGIYEIVGVGPGDLYRYRNRYGDRHLYPHGDARGSDPSATWSWFRVLVRLNDGRRAGPCSGSVARDVSGGQ